MKYSKIVWLAAAVGLLSACQTAMDRRISTHGETWRGLAQEDRHRLLQGYVRDGDTEDMVRIAFGPPDKALPITGGNGQKQTVWLYDLLEFGAGYSPSDPNSSPHLTSRERSVVFQDGVVVDRAGTAVTSRASLAEYRARLTAEDMTEHLDLLVALTPEQQVKARGILEKANAELFVFSPSERPEKGMEIRIKRRADIRAMLTPEQQARFDAAHQPLGGGASMLVVRSSPAPR